MARLSLLITVSCLFASCSLLRKSAKYSFTDDYYTLKKEGVKEKVYVDFEEEEINIYSLDNKQSSSVSIDSTVAGTLFPKESNGITVPQLKFGHNNFDLDLFTIPVKLRPAQNGIPAQLNANVNGAVYAGFRHDRFNLTYNPNPLGRMKRSIAHYGISFGAFTGIGNTFMSPTNTNFQISTEYDGVVWIKGIAVIAALNNFSAGLSIGTDNLTDRNRKVWNYEGKPWIGLVLGLNLN